MTKFGETETFAVCQLGDEEGLRPGGLPLSRAFGEIVRRAHMTCEFDVKDGQHRLLMREGDAPEGAAPWLIILSDFGNSTTARRDLMIQTLGGVKELVAVPDSLIQRAAQSMAAE